MSFDPTKPVEDSPVDAAEIRNQLNAAIIANSAGSVVNADTFGEAVSTFPCRRRCS